MISLLLASSLALVPIPEAGSHQLFELACPNGARAVVDARPGTGTVFVLIGARAGSRDEEPRLAGLSHLLEHMLFKEESFDELRAAGGLVNATTDFEMTEYHADLPADRLEQGWRALAAMVAGARAEFPPDELAREKHVVRQETALGKTDPLAIVAYSVLGRIFPGDPVGQPVIGFRRTLRRIEGADLAAYHRSRYAPANLVAVIAGEVQPDRAAALMEETICSRPASGPPRAPYPAPRPRLRPLYRFRTLVEQSYLLAGSLTAGAASEDAVSLELLAAILGEGRSSRLHQRLVAREAIAHEVVSLSFQLSNLGAFVAGVAVQPRLASPARAALLEEIGRLAAEPVRSEELLTARRLVQARLAREMETNEGRAGIRARRLLEGRPTSLDELTDRLARATPDQLQQAARRHWGAGPVEVQVLPARGPGKIFAALRFLLFRRL